VPSHRDGFEFTAMGMKNYIIERSRPLYPDRAGGKFRNGAEPYPFRNSLKAANNGIRMYVSSTFRDCLTSNIPFQQQLGSRLLFYSSIKKFIGNGDDILAGLVIGVRIIYYIHFRYFALNLN
jgi:hypothetical protein